MQDPQKMRLNWMGGVFRRLGRALALSKARATRAQIARDDARLVEGAVVNRIPELKAEDAYDLAAVERAFREMKPQDLALTLKVKGYDVRHFYWPAGKQHYGRQRAARGDDEPKHHAYAMESNNRYEVLYETEPGNLPPGTPGLVWNVIERMDVAFVTLDGGVYRTNVRNLMNGLQGPDAWPTKPQHVNLLRDDLIKLSGLGHLTAGLGERIEALDKKKRACADREWKWASPKFDAIAAADIRPSTRANRQSLLRQKVYARIKKKCDRFNKAFEKLWLAAVDARTEARQALLEKNRARLMELVKAAQAGAPAK